MVARVLPSAALFIFFISTLQHVSAFSTSSNHDRSYASSTSSHTVTTKRRQRIGTISTKHQGDTRNSCLFADASDTAVKTVEKQDDEEPTIPTDPAKTTPQFLAGLWKLIAKGNHLVRGVSRMTHFLSNPLPHSALNCEKLTFKIPL